MKSSRQLTVILLVVISALPIPAQESSARKLGGLEFGIGINTFGPAHRMSNLMVENGFDDKVLDWVLFEQDEYPNYAPLGLGFQISYSWYVSQGSQAGIQINYARLREVSGYSAISGPLDILFSSTYLAPIYIFEMGRLEIKAGPALMINSGKTTNLYDENVDVGVEKHRKLSPGLLAGMDFRIWDGTNTYGKIATHYVLTTRNNMGPFSAIYGFGNKHTIPESKIGFGHLNIGFILGIQIWEFSH